MTTVIAAAARWPAALQRVRLADVGETGADGFHRSWIMLFPVGQFTHPQYGDLDFTRAKLADIKALWERRVRHIDVALDVDHKAGQDDSRATGWIERLELRDGAQDGAPSGLWGQIKWTPYGLRLLRDDEYRYFSPEFGPWTDPETDQRFDDVLMGGALTNRPFLKVMPAIKLADGAAISRKPWGSVNKSQLPRACFLDQGAAADKSSWRLPVYEGAGPKDADGHYTQRGPLNINGVRAALAALGGARTGDAMTGVPAGVKTKLQGWLAKYGGSASASERGAPARKARIMAKSQAQATDNNIELIELDEESAQLFADDGEEYADDVEEMDDTEELDEGGADDDSAGPDAEDEANSGEDDNAFDPNADRHGAMTTKSHSHGKYAGHGHSNDGSHDGVPTSGKKSASDRKGLMGAKTAVKTTSERREPTAQPQQPQQMRESAEVRKLREEVANVRYQLYETQVGKTLDGWKAQTFQFRESAKGAPKSGRIALTKVFAEAYRAFMLHEGITLSEPRRTKLNELIELALSTAIVDLSERASSYTQDAPGGGRAPGSGNASDRLQDHAEKLAAAEYSGKQLSELTDAQKMAIYERASREIGYK